MSPTHCEEKYMLKKIKEQQVIIIRNAMTKIRSLHENRVKHLMQLAPTATDDAVRDMSDYFWETDHAEQYHHLEMLLIDTLDMHGHKYESPDRLRAIALLLNTKADSMLSHTQ
jgi:hypothetical protein